jgi:hypothetical protein
MSTEYNENKMYTRVWLWLALVGCVIAINIGVWATVTDVSTAGKDNDATYTARINACVSTGASYIHGDCVQVKCVP